MNKTILIAGASGLVGGRLLTNLKSSENHLVLLGRNQIVSEKNINQIITDFDNIENLRPVIPTGSSDSAALDSVFELLNISGQPAPLAKLMLVPDAWSKKSETLPKDHQQLFNFLNSTMEPWDGPAAIAGTDNEWVIAANDRNGLRPLRYAITKDNLLFAGSETGMIELNEKRILSKGRLGPVSYTHLTLPTKRIV